MLANRVSVALLCTSPRIEPNSAIPVQQAQDSGAGEGQPADRGNLLPAFQETGLLGDCVLCSYIERAGESYNDSCLSLTQPRVICQRRISLFWQSHLLFTF